MGGRVVVREIAQRDGVQALHAGALDSIPSTGKVPSQHQAWSSPSFLFPFPHCCWDMNQNQDQKGKKKNPRTNEFKKVYFEQGEMSQRFGHMLCMSEPHVSSLVSHGHLSRARYEATPPSPTKKKKKIICFCIFW